MLRKKGERDRSSSDRLKLEGFCNCITPPEGFAALHLSTFSGKNAFSSRICTVKILTKNCRTQKSLGSIYCWFYAIELEFSITPESEHLLGLLKYTAV
jgi:hypothetical protein